MDECHASDSAPVVIALSAPPLPAQDLSLDGAGLVTLSSIGTSRIIDVDKGGAKNLRLRDLRQSSGTSSSQHFADLAQVERRQTSAVTDRRVGVRRLSA